MIFIAYDYEGYPISIINAKDQALAIAYWHGASIVPNTIKSLDDFASLEDHPTGVYPILKTKETNIRQTDFGSRYAEKKYILVSK